MYICPDARTWDSFTTKHIYIPLFKIKMLAKQVLQGIVNFHTVKRLIVFYMKDQISINVFHAV